MDIKLITVHRLSGSYTLTVAMVGGCTVVVGNPDGMSDTEQARSYIQDHWSSLSHGSSIHA